MKASTPKARKVSVVALILVAVTGLLISQSFARREAADWRFNCKTGPWGKIECVRIAVEMPEAFVTLNDIKDSHAHWFFGAHSQQQTEAFLKASGLNETDLQTLLRNAKWEVDNRGCWVSPSDEFVLKMNGAAREKIYNLLSKYPENPNQQSPFIFRSELLPKIFERSHLKPATIEAFKETTYAAGKHVAFADTDIFVNNLGDEREKIRFLKTISRTSTLLVKLHVDSSSDIDALVDYWSFGKRRKDVRALIESMASVPGGAKIDVAHLLPMFLRQRIYTYPNPEIPGVTNRHCHWTSMNFLNEVPDDRFSDEDYSREVVQRDFTPITDEPRLGDVIFFLDSAGMVIHSATYIADNIVFTKNGGAPNRPWVYMELPDLMTCYMKVDEPMQTVIWRRKNPMAASIDVKVNSETASLAALPAATQR